VTRLTVFSGFSLPQLEDKLLLQTNQYLCGDPRVNRVDFIQTTKPTIAHGSHPWEPPNARMERKMHHGSTVTGRPELHERSNSPG